MPDAAAVPNLIADNLGRGDHEECFRLKCFIIIEQKMLWTHFLLGSTSRPNINILIFYAGFITDDYKI